MTPWVVLALAIFQVSKWFDLPGFGGQFLSSVMAMGIAQPAAAAWPTAMALAQPVAAWPMAVMALINVTPSLLNWWSAYSTQKTTSTIPQVRFISPIPAEEAFVIPEYLTILETSVTRLIVEGGDSGLPPALQYSFQQAMEQAKLLKGIHDALMTDIGMRFAGHYDRLSRVYVGIERAIIDIANRNETKPSWFGAWFTADKPYARASRHQASLLAITSDILKASKSEFDSVTLCIGNLDVFITRRERHGAICGVRSHVLKEIHTWSKEAKDVRAEAKVMCNSSKHSAAKLNNVQDALVKVCMTRRCHL